MKVLRSNLVPMQMRRLEPGIKWATYPRIEPGEYRAYCKAVRWYFDRPYRRWVCLLRFDVLSPDLLQTVACLPFFLNGGSGEQPKAGRRSRLFREWIRAAGRAPASGVRPSLQVFRRRIARVVVRDTEGLDPYSVVCQVSAWETGFSPSHLVNQSHSQVRLVSKPVKSALRGDST